MLPTNGIHLHVVCKGNPNHPAVVFLHGFPEAWFEWEEYIDLFVEKGFYVVVPDQRGYNLSDKPKEIKAYIRDELAKDIIGLLDFLGLDQVFLVGHDWGGAVAWHLAFTFPQRFLKISILNVPHPHFLKKKWKEDRIQRKKSHYIFFFQLPWLPEWSLRRNHWKTLALGFLRDPKKGTYSEEEIERYKESWAQPDAITSMLNWYRAEFRNQKDSSPTPKLELPLLLLWGEEDRYLGVDTALESLSCCSQGRLEILKGISHWSPKEAPEKIAPLLLDFFGKR